MSLTCAASLSEFALTFTPKAPTTLSKACLSAKSFSPAAEKSQLSATLKITRPPICCAQSAKRSDSHDARFARSIFSETLGCGVRFLDAARTGNRQLATANRQREAPNSRLETCGCTAPARRPSRLAWRPDPHFACRRHVASFAAAGVHRLGRRTTLGRIALQPPRTLWWRYPALTRKASD